MVEGMYIFPSSASCLRIEVEIGLVRHCGDVPSLWSQLSRCRPCTHIHMVFLGADSP